MLSRIRLWLIENAIDVAWAAGLLLATIGFALAWTPLGFIVPGLLLLGMATWSEIRKPPLREPNQDKEDATDD